MSEQPKLRHLDATIREWLIDDAEQSTAIYHGMHVSRGEAYECVLLCVGNMLQHYGCAETQSNLDIVQQIAWDAVLNAYGSKEQTA